MIVKCNLLIPNGVTKCKSKGFHSKIFTFILIRGAQPTCYYPPLMTSARQERNEGERGINSLDTEWLCGAPKSPNNITSTFSIQYICFLWPQVRTWGRQTCSLQRAPSDLVTSLPPGNSRYFYFYVLLLFCFHTLSLAWFHTSIWPPFS